MCLFIMSIANAIFDDNLLISYIAAVWNIAQQNYIYKIKTEPGC